MSDTTFVNQVTPIVADWLNDVNDRVYKTEGGSATFAAATTKDVTFVTVQADTNYYIALGPQANKTFWVTSKTITGFTLNASSSSSDIVDWVLFR